MSSERRVGDGWPDTSGRAGGPGAGPGHDAAPGSSAEGGQQPATPWTPLPTQELPAYRGDPAPPRRPETASSAYAAPYPMPQPPTPGSGGPSSRRGVGVGAVVLLMLIALLLGVVLGLGAAQVLEETTDGGLPVAAGTGTVVTRPPDSVAGIAASVLPGVVYIEVRSGAGRTSGSGFVIREDGYLLTNNHVVVPGEQGDIDVVFADGSEESAQVVGRTADYDLAVLKVDRDGLEPLTLGDSDALAVGDPVVAVGAPLGLEGTVTSGIVSAVNRPVRVGEPSATTFINAIQTDAAINPGNSGGPLVNLAGEVIGINTVIAQPAGAAETGNIGLGFAIPSSQARRTADEIIETGQATYPVIGVLLDVRYTGRGVRVAEQAEGGQEPITPGGPAAEAGVQPGDVILRLDDTPVTDPNELIVSLRAHAPGEEVTLTVLRDGSEREVRVTLGEAVSE